MTDPSITETGVFTSIRAYLLSIADDGIEVFQGQANRVAEPKGQTFVVMTPTNRVRLGTNVDTWDETADDPTTKTILHNAQFDMQLDIHGPGGSDLAAVIAATFVDDYGRDMLATGGLAPLYSSDGHQMPFINGEQQYENRWVVMLSCQIKPAVSTPMQFAATLVPVLIPALGG